ncbi:MULTISPECIES: HdeD family acid-resistance protein [Olivibacter]|jgi:hypothetical protein|uniref:HdeD family acid-resistance protein n=2 Tax=Olivibacter TaxID=376469 RepID=A0ABV6HM12_9SPHI|nr:DUF308 domain-containing protein [Olivibacter jilunii]MCL4642252.1 DUF308 domain-containing protein [Olivibacter sp. UJ_SKK_5.1]MDX3917394.1 DUF308 domain-containing protein [Pseudosphingobacterium sp.]
MERDIKKSTQLNKRILITGILLVIIGFLTLWRPFQSYLFISLSFSVLIIVSGVLEILFIIQHQKIIKMWLTMLVGGIIDVTMGIYLLLSPLIMMIILTPLISIWVFYKGFTALRFALLLRAYAYQRWWLQLAMGVAIMLISLIIVSSATASFLQVIGFLNTISWTGLGIVLIGITAISLSVVYRNTGRLFRRGSDQS